ncbi:MAG: multiheme c-type cytochrome [Planctomycetota bacterium]
MSLWVRLALVGGMLFGAALFVYALQSGAEERPVDVEETPEKVVVAYDAPPAKPGVLDSSDNCKECHAEIYEEWSGDRHAKAWVGELYTELSNNHTDPNCWSCHAPRPILETGLDSPAEARGEDRESGIDCLSCHRQGNHVVGPSKTHGPVAGRNPDCGPVFDPNFSRSGAQEETAKFCGVCHNLHGTCDEFMGSQYARDGDTCLSCHMEETMAPAVTGGPAKARGKHAWPGAHSERMLKRAMKFEASVDGDTLHGRIINKGAGHKIPTDARHRAIYLRVAFVDRFGQPIQITGVDPISRKEVTDRELSMDVVRLFYRQEQRPSTQIPPKGTLGQNNWRDSTFPIPREAKGGKVRLKLIYHLKWSWPMHRGVLVQEMELEIPD